MTKVSRQFIFAALLAVSLLAACIAPVTPPTALPTITVAPLTETPAPTETPTLTISPTAIPTLADSVRFAVIGDYGLAGHEEQAVAELIESWQVDFIVTTGDNNYPVGSADTIERNIGQYYHAYIGNYQGEYGEGSLPNRFFPSLGNHDWNPQAGFQPYTDYFSLPGNERYYEVVLGPVHLFMLNSDPNEPDGVGVSSIQASWLESVAADSTSLWKIAAMHHPAYSSSRHGSTDWMQWPFAEWGLTVAVGGHDHVYERLVVDGFPYITSGLGGNPSRYGFFNILPESLVRYNEMHGALLVEANADWIRFDFINIEGEVIDSFTITAE